MTRIDVKSKGPMFDGRAQREVGNFIDEAEQDIGKVGFDMVRTELDQVLQNPTGYYESHITVSSEPEVTISDGGVVYGPWLEGTGSRNARSRFKGYATFRRVTQKLQDRAVQIAQGLLPKYIDRMNS